MGISNKWLLGSKRNLWRALEKAYGLGKARELSAPTWALPGEFGSFKK